MTERARSGAPRGSEPASTVNGRRELTAAVLGAVVAGALALVSGGQAWAQVTAQREPPLPPTIHLISRSPSAVAIADSTARAL